jgi:hypothetical protein
LGLAGGAIALPHLLRLERVAPAVAIVLWACALALRGLTSILAALLVVLAVPHSPVIDPLAYWCWETVVPVSGVRLSTDGHRLGDAATLLPALLIGGSGLVVLDGAIRASRAVGRLLRRHALGVGPSGSVIIGGDDVVMASAGLAHPRVLVSAGALVALDDDELAAGLAHERGHIARRHRFILLFAEACGGLGRFLPGTRGAVRQLVFHLERDADRWALARRHDPIALARAVRKAGGGMTSTAGYAALDGAIVAERIAQLLESPSTLRRAARAALHLVAAGMLALTVALMALMPGAAAAGFEAFTREHPAEQCGDHERRGDHAARALRRVR